MLQNLTAFRITLIYLLVAVVWIAVSDRALAYLVSDPILLSQFQTYKGLFYVIATSVGLYFLIKTREKQIQRKAQELVDLTKLYDSDQELMEKLFNRIPVLLTVYNPEFDTFQVNREFKNVTGWASPEIGEIDLMEVCFPALELREEVAEFMNTPGSGWKDFELVTKHGDIIPTSWNNFILSDRTRVGIGIDLTDLKESKLQISKSQQLLEKVFESLKESVIILESETRTIIDCNKATEELFGYTRDKLIGSSTKQLHLNEEQFEKFSEIGEHDLRENGIFKTEFKMKRKDGKSFHTDHTVTLVYDDHGELELAVSVIRDITEKKRILEALKESEHQYRHMFENNPESMFIYNPKTLEIVEANKSAVRQYEYSKEEFRSMTLVDIHAENDLEKIKMDLEQHQGMDSYGEEWVHSKKDGTRINVEISATDIKYNDNLCRLALVKDITVQKQIQDRVLQSLVEGEDRERQRIANDLHDGLSQHLVAAKMNLESVKKDIKQLSSRRINQFETGFSLLKQALSETHNIVHNLMPRVLEDYGLVSAVENLVLDFKTGSEIQFFFSTSGDFQNLNTNIEINLYRILQELITNAVRHSECSTLSISLEQLEGLVICSVEDNGKGMMRPVDQKQNGHGGLGLTSIQTRVKILNGNYNIESVPGEGTKITVRIPLVNNLSMKG